MFNIWADYSETKAIRILNSELADSLGNLLNRCSGRTVNPDQIIPHFCQHSFSTYCNSDEALALVESLSALPGKWPPNCLAEDFGVCVLPIFLCVASLLFYIYLHIFRDVQIWELRLHPLCLVITQFGDWKGGGYGRSCSSFRVFLPV